MVCLCVINKARSIHKIGGGWLPLALRKGKRSVAELWWIIKRGIGLEFGEIELRLGCGFCFVGIFLLSEGSLSLELTG